MSKKKIIVNLVIILIVTALTTYYMISSNLFKDISKLKDLTFWGSIIIVGMICVYVLSDSYIISKSMKRINKDAKFGDGVGAYLLGNLGSNVTPWKSGHFPFAAYYYNKKKYSFEETLTIVSNNHLVYSTCLVFFYMIFMIVSLVHKYSVDIGNVTIDLYLVALFGSVSNLVYIIFIILLIKSKRVQALLLKLEVFVYHKFHKTKDIEEYKKTKLTKMKVYEECFNDYTHRFYLYIKPIIAYIFFMLANYGLPYIIYLVLSGNTFNLNDYLYFFLLMQAMKYVSNIIPIPGGTGVTEYCFIAVYTVVMGESYVSVALLIWRLLTYFGLIIIDFIYFLLFNSRTQIKEIKEVKEG